MKLKGKSLFAAFFLFLTLLFLWPPLSPIPQLLKKDLGLTIQKELLEEWQNEQVSLKIYGLANKNFKGLVMLVKTRDITKIQVTAAERGPGTLETTSSMAKRTGAIAGINGGGFFNKSEYGDLVYYPVYITISNGKLVANVNRTSKAVAAVCITETGELLIDADSSPEQLLAMGVREAVSFSPLLIKEGQKVPVRKLPPDPRTGIGATKDGTFIMVVIDGRKEHWSRGVTLEEMQDIFLEHGAWIASNLDGGGSSTMVFEGKVLNRPSDLMGERPVATSILIYP